MKRTAKLGVVVAAFVMAAGLAWAAGGDAVMNKITKDGYVFMIHLKAIPDQNKKAAKGSHHLAVMINDPQRVEVADATVTYEFLKDGKVVASGPLPWMAARRGEGEGGGGGGGGGNMGWRRGRGDGGQRPRKTGHYGSEVTLPGPGAYNLNITMTRGGSTVKATTLITAP